MLIDCPYCRSRVDAKTEGEAIKPSMPDDPDRVRIAIGKCPSCDTILVGRSEEYEHPDFGTGWAMADRLWPKPPRQIGWSVPDIVKSSLEEADLCISAGAFTACVVMSGRAIEGVCVHHNTKSTELAKGLKELLAKDVIDKRLFTWGDALRKLRNLGAHATGERFTAQDASDVLAFTHAIAEYVFVLTEQFEDFMQRQAKRPAKKPKVGGPSTPASP